MTRKSKARVPVPYGALPTLEKGQPFKCGICKRSVKFTDHRIVVDVETGEPHRDRCSLFAASIAEGVAETAAFLPGDYVCTHCGMVFQPSAHSNLGDGIPCPACKPMKWASKVESMAGQNALAQTKTGAQKNGIAADDRMAQRQAGSGMAAPAQYAQQVDQAKATFKQPKAAGSQAREGSSPEEPQLSFSPVPFVDPNPAKRATATIDASGDITGFDFAPLIANTPGTISSAPRRTSVNAAMQVPTGKRRLQVLKALIDCDEWPDEGDTCEGICNRTRLPGSTVRPRLLELAEGEWVSRLQETRPTASGGTAHVWKVTTKGKAAFFIAQQKGMTE